MAKNLFDDNKEITQEERMEEYPKVKQMIRWLSGATEGSRDAIQEVDAELNSWIEKGYTLFAAHYLGTDNLAYGVLYVLVHD